MRGKLRLGNMKEHWDPSYREGSFSGTNSSASIFLCTFFSQLRRYFMLDKPHNAKWRFVKNKIKKVSWPYINFQDSREIDFSLRWDIFELNKEKERKYFWYSWLGRYQKIFLEEGLSLKKKIKKNFFSLPKEKFWKKKSVEFSEETVDFKRTSTTEKFWKRLKKISFEQFENWT